MARSKVTPPKPRTGYKARVKTRARGGANIKPENAAPRSRTKGRASVDPDTRAPQGVPSGIKPENYQARNSNGDHQADRRARGKMQRPKPTPWRKSGDSKTTSNPLK